MKLLVLLPILAGLLGFVGWRHHERAMHIRHFNAIASEIAGRKVTVHCPNAIAALVDVSAEQGTVMFRNQVPDEHTDVKKEICDDLIRVENGDSIPFARAATAVEVLAHESFHLRGFMDEAVTECYAVQTEASVAEQLGVDAKHAHTMAVYSDARIPDYLPEEYSTPDCHDGGPLDLHPGSAVWP